MTFNGSSRSRLRHELRSAFNSGFSYLGLAFFFSVFSNLLMLTGPVFMLQVYDRILTSRSQETLVALFLLVALLYGLMAGLDFARGRIVARFGARFTEEQAERYDKLTELDESEALGVDGEKELAALADYAAPFYSRRSFAPRVSDSIEADFFFIDRYYSKGRSQPKQGFFLRL